MSDETEFERELTALINRHSVENGSDTPDYILARYMGACLQAFEVGVRQRELWYGRYSEALTVLGAE